MPIPLWFAQMLAPYFRVLGAQRFGNGIRIDLVDSAGQPIAAIVDEAGGTPELWAYTTAILAIGSQTPGARTERYAHIGELLSIDGERVVRFLRLSRWLTRCDDQSEPMAGVNGTWWAGLLLGCHQVTRQAIDAEMERRAVDSARQASDPVGRAAAVHILVAMGLFAEALDLWSKLPDRRCDATPELALTQALMLALLGRGDDAASWIEVLERLAPDSERHRRACAGFWKLRRRADRELPHVSWCVAEGGCGSLAFDWIELARIEGELRGPLCSAEILRDMPADLHPDTRSVLQAVDYLIDADRDDLAECWLNAARERDPADRDLAVAAATLALWRGETTRSRALLHGIKADDPRVLRILGAGAVVDGRIREALGLLDQCLLLSPDDIEAALWRVEAHLRARAWERASAELDRTIPRANDYPVAQLLRTLANPWIRRWGRIPSAFGDGFTREELVAICGATAVELGHQSAGALHELLWTALQRLGGNRSSRLTVLGPVAADGKPRRLLRVRLIGARKAAAQNLLRLSTASVEEVIARFDDLALRYPHSPHPYTYRGELMLWLGDYRQALRDFRQAHARVACRWEYIGRAAAWMMVGRPLRAALLLQVGSARFGSVTGATTLVYRGELLRRAGFTHAAIRDLSTAVGEKPSRVGAWMQLALAKARLGERDEAASIRQRLRREAPGILWESLRGEAPDRPSGADEANMDRVFERALQMMRGNRSSAVHTIFTAQGELRVIPSPAEWRALARETLAIPRAVLEAYAFAGT